MFLKVTYPNATTNVVTFFFLHDEITFFSCGSNSCSCEEYKLNIKFILFVFYFLRCIFLLRFSPFTSWTEKQFVIIVESLQRRHWMTEFSSYNIERKRIHRLNTVFQSKDSLDLVPPTQRRNCYRILLTLTPLKVTNWNFKHRRICVLWARIVGLLAYFPHREDQHGFLIKFKNNNKWNKNIQSKNNFVNILFLTFVNIFVNLHMYLYFRMYEGIGVCMYMFVLCHFFLYYWRRLWIGGNYISSYSDGR